MDRIGNVNYFAQTGTGSVPKVAVVILNWNNYRDTRECLTSLEQLDHAEYGVIVVDNGSTDGSATRLEDEFAQHEFIRNRKNLGFAAGSNVGIRYALKRGADYVLLLNNDATVSPNLVTEMLKIAEEDPKTGLIGGRIYRYGTDEIHHAGGKVVTWGATARSFRGQEGAYVDVRNVGFIIGCLMLIRAKMIEQIGLLDENYFFGGEDVEYCWRARKAGWDIKVNPKAEIWHKVSASAGGEGSPFLFYHSTRNRLYFAQELEVQDRIAFYIFFVFSRLARLFQWRLSGKDELIVATLSGVRDFFRGETGNGSH